MFEQTFSNIDDILHKDAGCGSELDYVEQTSWILFLKYLDDLEKDKKTAAQLAGEAYTDIIAPEYKWEVWACPKKDGKLDQRKLPLLLELKYNSLSEAEDKLGSIESIISTFIDFQKFLYGDGVA